MDEQERKRFEEWARPDNVQMQRNPETGAYTERGMNAAWAGWQAAARVEREACAEVCRRRENELQLTILTANPHTSPHITLRREARLLEAGTCASEILARSNARANARP